MRLYVEGDGWNGTHDDLFFTESMLLASKVHAELAAPLTQHLAAWDAIDAERTQANRAVVRNSASVVWENVTLDGLTTHFGGQLLLDCKDDRKHPTFARFFPDGVQKVTKRGLEFQLADMKKFPTFAQEIELSPAGAAALKAVTDQFASGEKVIKDRKEAALGVTRVSVKTAQWRDEANNVRRAAETALHDYANKHGLPRDYADDFFPTQKKPAAKAEDKPASDEKLPPG